MALTINVNLGVKSRDDWSPAAREAAAKARREKAGRHEVMAKRHMVHANEAKKAGEKGGQWQHETAAVFHSAAAKRYHEAAEAKTESQGRSLEKKAEKPAWDAAETEAFHSIQGGAKHNNSPRNAEAVAKVKARKNRGESPYQ